jgi:3-carboxy-cis,cis-muconate cycloisomerase
MSYTFAISPFMKHLFADEMVVGLFSVGQDLAALLAFEVDLARAQEKCGVIPSGMSRKIETAIDKVKVVENEFEAGLARDGVVVPIMVSTLKAAMNPEDARYVHFNTTSQDAIDTSLMLRALPAMGGIYKNVQALEERLTELAKKFGSCKLMGRTRMQQALPITVGHRLDSWKYNIETAALSIQRLSYPVQLSGPVGTYRDEKVQKALAKALGLSVPTHSWQNERGPVLALGNACAGLTGALGKIGADIALMAQNELAEIKIAGGGTSSAMAHKKNPVKAENLVSLARLNASLLSALHNAAIHEQERSGAAWTLEWLVLPQMICAAAGAVHMAHALLQSVESIGT